MQTTVYISSRMDFKSRLKHWWIRFNVQAGLKHMGLLFALMGYTIGGAMVFRELESPEEKARLANYSVKVFEARKLLVKSLAEYKNLDNFEDFCSKYIRDYEQVLKKAFVNGLEDFSNTEENLEKLEKWTDVRAIFFSATVLTTIGYGDIVPVTKEGRIFCIIFALVGIPLTLTVIADWGRLFASKLSTVVHHMPPLPLAIRKAIQARRTFSFVLSGVSFLIIYLAVGACFVSWEENWTFLDGFYFCFITLTTIGFGDLVPQNHKNMLGFTLTYILLGLALTSTIIELVRRQYAQYWRQLQAFSGPLANNLRKLAENAPGLDVGAWNLQAFSGPLTNNLKKLAENAPGLDVGAFQQDLWRAITLVSMTKKAVTAVKEKEKEEKETHIHDWESAVEAVIRDMATTNKQKQVQIVIYESSV